jgi:hypothetical protein
LAPANLALLVAMELTAVVAWAWVLLAICAGAIALVFTG